MLIMMMSSCKLGLNSKAVILVLCPFFKNLSRMMAPDRQALVPHMVVLFLIRSKIYNVEMFQIADIMSSFGGNLTTFASPTHSPSEEEFNVAFEAYMDSILTRRERGTAQ